MIYPFEKYKPEIHPTAYIAPGAIIIGRVVLEENVNVWCNAVIRGDVDAVVVGKNSNIQDLCVLHQDKGYPCIIGKSVTVGHRAILHGCKVDDNALIGMGAIILSGAEIGKGAVIGAGSLVTQNKKIPPYTLALGSPAKVIRELTDEEISEYSKSAQNYIDIAGIYENFTNKCSEAF